MDAGAAQQEIAAHHTCTCETCDSALMTMLVRQGPQHVAVRFWEQEVAGDLGGRRILLDGRDVSGVYEALLGEDGVVWRYRQEPGGKHACLTCLRRYVNDGRLPPNGEGLFYYGQDGQLMEWGPKLNACKERLTGTVEMRVEERQ